MNSIEQSGRRGIVIDFELYGLIWTGRLWRRVRDRNENR